MKRQTWRLHDLEKYCIFSVHFACMIFACIVSQVGIGLCKKSESVNLKSIFFLLLSALMKNNTRNK